MSAPLPPYRVLSAVGSYSVLAVQFPDFTEGQMTIRTDLIDTPEGQASIRRFIDSRGTIQDALRAEF